MYLVIVLCVVIAGGRDYMEDEFFVAESERYKLLAVYGE
jgi:hypothetical protein